MTVYTTGGKKYGQLKTKQQNELDSINQVSVIMITASIEQ